MKKIFLSLSILFLGITASPVCCSVSAASIKYLVQTGAAGSPTWRNTVNGEILVDLTVSGQSFNAWYNATVVATDEVWLINGTYSLSGVITMNKINHSVYGGFAGTETSINDRPKVAAGRAYEFLHPTVLDAHMASPVISQTTASTTNVLFDGLTITNGFNAANGGGAFIRDGFTLQNSIISNCTATSAGGVYLYTGGLLKNCLVENNKANQGGGVIATSSIVSVKPMIVDCIIQNNNAYTDGGGLRVQHVAPGLAPEIKSTIIRGNTALDANSNPKFGSAIQVTMGNPVFSNCVIANNSGLATVNMYGGEFLNTTIVNSIGFSVYINPIANGSSKFTNCLIWGNVRDGEPASPIDGNITLQNNTKVEIVNCGLSPEIRSGTSYTQTNNFILEASNDSQEGNKGPGFSKPTSFIGSPMDAAQKAELDVSSWYIKSTSGAIDRGVSLPNVTTDLSGRARPYGSAYDVGAYENDGTTRVDVKKFGYNYYSKDRKLFVEGVSDGETVDVYNVGGIRLTNIKVFGSNVTIDVPSQGLYILKIANKVTKVIVK